MRSTVIVANVSQLSPAHRHPGALSRFKAVPRAGQPFDSVSARLAVARRQLLIRWSLVRVQPGNMAIHSLTARALQLAAASGFHVANGLRRLL